MKSNEHWLISKDELENLYKKQKLTMAQIGKMYKCTRQTVLRRIHKFDIRLLTRKLCTRVQDEILFVYYPIMTTRELIETGLFGDLKEKQITSHAIRYLGMYKTPELLLQIRSKALEGNKNRKGKKLTEEHKAKISKANSGKYKIITEQEVIACSMYLSGFSTYQIANHFLCATGTILNILIRYKITRRTNSETKRGRKLSEEHRIKISKANKGKKRSPETIAKISKGLTGKNNGNWKGGITPENIKIRTSSEYNKWRKKVFEKDNYICQGSGKEHNYEINAHHIKPFAKYPELRFDIDNGITLCVDCHIKVHKRKREE